MKKCEEKKDIHEEWQEYIDSEPLPEQVNEGLELAAMIMIDLDVRKKATYH